jgi:hypothetical protein
MSYHEDNTAKCDNEQTEMRGCQEFFDRILQHLVQYGKNYAAFVDLSSLLMTCMLLSVSDIVPVVLT